MRPAGRVAIGAGARIFVAVDHVSFRVSLSLARFRKTIGQMA
jgi:hypothetical protein